MILSHSHLLKTYDKLAYLLPKRRITIRIKSASLQLNGQGSLTIVVNHRNHTTEFKNQSNIAFSISTLVIVIFTKIILAVWMEEVFGQDFGNIAQCHFDVLLL